MTKQELWTQVYIESLKNDFSTVKAETAATQAVKAFERVFTSYELPEIYDCKTVLNPDHLINFKYDKSDIWEKDEDCGCDKCDNINC